MKILFCSAHPYIPQITGGAQASTHEMSVQLRNLGHEVSVLAGLTGEGWLGLRGRLGLKLGRGVVRDTGLGYPVYRTWFPVRAVRAAVARARPDVAVLQSGLPVPLARAFAAEGVPAVYYFRNAEEDDLGGDPASVPGTTAIANSNFTARYYADRYGMEATVILPMITPDHYRTETTRETVTFVNPHPHKGLDTALAMAEACPDIPFLFVEAWSLDADLRERLVRETGRLPNVTLLPPTNDMRAVYARTGVLLAPSQWQEAFGRVAAEAQISGIPVVASDCGGLPEAVGDGGSLVAPDAHPDDWIAALRALWDDPDRYEAAAAAARARAGRPALRKEEQARQLVSVLEAAAAQGAGRAGKAGDPEGRAPARNKSRASA